MNNTSRMPALFLGHGSPMNVLESNAYTQAWQTLGETLPRPKAIIAVSAHWYTRGTAVTAMENPRTIHDFGGFPKALFDTQYPAPGSPELAARIQQVLAPHPVTADHSQWGLDHGSWGVLIKMYPNADIPVVQLSVDGTQPAEYHYELGRKLAALRDEGIMIVASGNVVHNLRMVKWDGDAEAYPWAISFNQFVRDNLAYQGNDHPLVNFMQHDGAALSNPTPDHYFPLLYVLGSWDGKEAISIPVDGLEMGSLSMLSVQVG
ncbi:MULTISPECIES: 4,5-DOPA dioxygenase extradiol [Pectobacterium]|uniref:4,5-DOPA-extradiol-dioxygenase n=1 Tax=Pectobacterium TaxID=122277 RepID=UPI001968FA04|nr:MULTISPECIES: 4,5-DOPA dioxygenase extradiol [Pectobacterium]GKW11192.1 dioxygenase [Pectobacterium carotovorum subsp. carotovorum]MBN3135716.1 4,5-DOPA dioxygenase extradiol [Pectobacterium punjabense]MCE5380286.1 4,5-DOPA dioxygenase extradiol [Pectobacterium punjabense]MCE9733663.1 4,5-DOPA dioxygenase extradiol [Pectobacterium sp. IFB5596]MDG0797976.1 4,5-DOPA dioxygenase extradiol [Pectobacterium punjabense]